MKELIFRAIDWTSIKLNLVSSLSLIMGDNLSRNLFILATISTFVYNMINIIKEIIKFKNK